DDEPANIEVVRRLLLRTGYQVLTAPNGEVGIELAKRERPDVVLMDVNMPGIDGFEVCRRLKRDATTRLLPVILITGLTATEDRVRGIDAGPDDFLSKPFAIDELRARVRSRTRLKRCADELEFGDSVILRL